MLQGSLLKESLRTKMPLEKNKKNAPGFNEEKINTFQRQAQQGL